MTLKQTSILLCRIALFVVYFWFGFLKIIGQSPASAMVHDLLNQMMPFVSFPVFIVLFGLFEVLIGLLFIIPGLERLAVVLFFLHIFTTALPLFVLPEVWNRAFVPALEGQYIIKNLALVACVVTIYSSVSTRKSKYSGTI